MLTAMKCPSLIKAIEADIARGDAVIVQLVSTGEACWSAGSPRFRPANGRT